MGGTESLFSLSHEPNHLGGVHNWVLLSRTGKGDSPTHPSFIRLTEASLTEVEIAELVSGSGVGFSACRKTSRQGSECIQTHHVSYKLTSPLLARRTLRI